MALDARVGKAWQQTAQLVAQLDIFEGEAERVVAQLSSGAERSLAAREECAMRQRNAAMTLRIKEGQFEVRSTHARRGTRDAHRC